MKVQELINEGFIHYGDKLATKKEDFEVNGVKCSKFMNANFTKNDVTSINWFYVVIDDDFYNLRNEYLKHVDVVAWSGNLLNMTVEEKKKESEESFANFENLVKNTLERVKVNLNKSREELKVYYENRMKTLNSDEEKLNKFTRL